MENKELIKRKISEMGLNVTSVKFLDTGTSKDSYVIFADRKKIFYSRVISKIPAKEIDVIK